MSSSTSCRIICLLCVPEIGFTMNVICCLEFMLYALHNALQKYYLFRLIRYNLAIFGNKVDFFSWIGAMFREIVIFARSF